MALGNETRSRDGLSTAELERLEAQLRQGGFRLVGKANERDLLPGEYLKRQQSSSVYNYAPPVQWQLVWAGPGKTAHAGPHRDPVASRHQPTTRR